MKMPGINILTYHSISEGAGPTCIPPRVFRQHLDILKACGYKAVSLMEAGEMLRREAEPLSQLIAITFDDGFADFATEAFPELRARGWSATVFLPAAKIGGTDDWEEGSHRSPLMTWDAVCEVGNHGIELGSHAMNHARLTHLPFATAREEIAASRRSIESTTGCSVTSFAPQYGTSNSKIREEIKKSYRLSVGTQLARVKPDSDPYDLPRIEMFYFQNARLWRHYLEGKSRIYFKLRKVLRSVCASAIGAWRHQVKDK